jgi:VanZ family protein
MIAIQADRRGENAIANRIVITTGRLYAWLAMAVVVLLVYGSFVPFQYVHLELPEAIQEIKRMVQMSGNGGGTRVDWSVNFLVTLPLGFFASGVWLVDRPLMPRMLWVFPLVLLSATLLSFGVEFGQIWFIGRVPSLADVAAQSLGTITGIGCWVAMGPKLTRWLNSFVIRQGQRERIEWLRQA